MEQSITTDKQPADARRKHNKKERKLDGANIFEHFVVQNKPKRL